MKTIQRVFHYLEGSAFLAVLSFLFAFLSVFCKMAIPFLTGFAIQRAVDAGASGAIDISLFLILIASCLVAGSLFRYLYDLLTNYLGQRIVKKMRDEVYVAINEASLSYIDTHYHGDLLLRLVNDIENVQSGLIAGAGALFEGVVQILFTLVFMFILNWIMAIATILLTPLSIVVSRFISRRNSKYYKEQNAKMGTLTAYSLESLHNLEASRAYGLEEEKSEEFDKINDSLRHSAFKANFAVSWINPATRLVNNIIYAVLAFIGGKMIWESFGDDDHQTFNPLSLHTQLLLAVATSIDALAVGISMACLGYERLSQLTLPLVMIGAVSVLFSVMGYLLGVRFGPIITRRLKPELAGGLVLLFIGIKVLVSHLFG